MKIAEGLVIRGDNLGDCVTTFEGIVMLLCATVFLVIPSVYPQVYHNGNLLWLYGVHMSPRDGYPWYHEMSEPSVEETTILPPSVFDSVEFHAHPTRAPHFTYSLPLTTTSEPPRDKVNLVARFNGESLILPNETPITRRKLKTITQTYLKKISTILVLSPNEMPTSLAGYFKNHRFDTDPLLAQRIVVFNCGEKLAMPAALSVLNFADFLLKQSQSPHEQVALGASEQKNIAAFLQFLTSQGDIKTDCVWEFPFQYVVSALRYAPKKIQDNLNMKIYNFIIPFKYLRRFIY